MRQSLICLAVAAAVLASPLALGADGKNRQILINNKSGYTVNEIYASNTSVSEWQEDILGEKVLLPGGTIRANIDDGTGHCMFDFRIVFEDGDQAEKRGFDVCKMEELNITDS
jgi:hypothetical protein